MHLNGITRRKIMNNQEDLYDVRIGFDTYAQYIRERLKKQKNWRDMACDTAELCLEIQNTPACSENYYLCNLIITVVICVLGETENHFDESDKARGQELLNRTKREIIKAISELEDMVDDSYPKTAD